MGLTFSGRTRFRRLGRDQEGSTAIEFAFGASILFTALAGALDLSMLMFVQTLLEGGLREASRYGITGATDDGESRETKIRNIVGDNLFNLIDIDDVTTTYKVYPSFGGIGQPEPYVDANHNGKYDAGETYTDINGNGQWDADQGKAGVGASGDVVLYTLSAPWTLLTPMIATIFGNGGLVTLTASVAVRNEPYPTSP